MGVLKSLLLWCQSMRAPMLVVSLMKTMINFAPMLGVVSIFLWSYVVFVVRFVFEWILKEANRSFSYGMMLLVLYHVLGGLTMVSYFRCALTSPKISDLDRTRLARGAAHPRYCESCKQPKPRRTHHCFWCGTCVLKMDHHCIWLGNCVAYNNYKYFVLMLGWVEVFCLFVSSTLSAHPEFRDPSRAGVASLGFALMIGVASLFFFHVYLVTANKTTMECGMRLAECTDPEQRNHKYDRGSRYANICAVLGDNPWLWFIPVQAPWDDPRLISVHHAGPRARHTPEALAGIASEPLDTSNLYVDGVEEHSDDSLKSTLRADDDQVSRILGNHRM